MRPVLKYLLAAALMVLPCSLFAQGLPKMKQADEVSSGMLPNGISYYIVSNPASKGRADFAIIQDGMTDVAENRSLLNNLEHTQPSKFLHAHGVRYNANGFLTNSRYGRIYQFSDVDITNSTVVDSTMLMILDLMKTCPYEQTVIISGDVSKDAYRTTLHTLGLTVGKVSVNPDKYQDSSESSMIRLADQAGDGTISYLFRVGRVSREQAGTPVPLVSELLARELGTITMQRIKDDLRSAGIPCHVVQNRGRLDIHVPDSLKPRSQEIVSSVFTDIATGGVTLSEFAQAKKIALDILIESGLKPGKSNEFYVRRCIDAALFGTNLASQTAIRNFFLNRKISATRELELFNNYAKAMYAEEANGQPGARHFRTYPYFEDILKVNVGKNQSKVLNTTKDPVTGGSLLTFTDGVRVIFKNDPSADGVYFCLAQRGGASSAKDLKDGESAHLSTVFESCRFAGVRGEDFHRMLLSEGIQISESVGLEDFRIEGKAPSDKMETVMKALLKMGYERDIDQEEFEYIRNCEILTEKIERVDIHDMMDSLMCPSYKYHRKSSAKNMRLDLPQRAEVYFQERFSNVSDGIFVFVGNIKETEMIEILSKYLGSFSTSRIYTQRDRVKYNLQSGRSTYIANSDDESLNIAATCLMGITPESYYAFLIGQQALSRALAQELTPLGMYASVDGRIDIAPVERFTIYIHCRPCLPDGLPEGVRPHSTIETLRAVRRVLEDVSVMNVADADFRSNKALVKGNIENELSTPEGMIKYVLYRYIEGKDLSSAHTKKMDKVAIDDVRLILEELNSSGVVEYILK